MKTPSQSMSLVDALSLFLPSGLLDYFTLVDSISQDTCFILYLEENAVIPDEHSHLHLHSKGFFPEIEVQDFPIRGKAVYLRIKRRRWEDPSTGQVYSRDWTLVASGTRITAEFGAFLKELLRQSCR
ncbi:ISAon1 family transposase N-terminal region protein [Phocaeicola sp.]